MGLFDIFSNSDANNAAASQTAGYNAGYNQLVPLLGEGTQALQQNYGQAIQPSQQNYAVSAQGQNQLANLLGLNGANGSATAQQALQNMPGYQFALNQGTQNVLRNQAATGQLNSGNTNMDLNNYAQGQAQQNYNNYVSQLQPFMQNATANASNIGNLYGQLGQGINQNYNTQGAAAYGTQVGIGNAQAQADYANLASSGALWGGILGAAGNAAKAFAGSDARLKEDIKPIGKHRNGLTIYSYRYKGSKRLRTGFLAHEVEKIRPEAVGTFTGRDIKYVDYRKAVR